MSLNNFILTIYAASLNDTVKLAGIGLGVSIIAIGISSILMGINGATRTLVSQAYGAKQLNVCNIVFAQGRIVLTCVYIILATVLLFSETFLIKAGQDK